MKTLPSLPSRQTFLLLALGLAFSLGGARAQQTTTYTNGEDNSGTITITGSTNPTTLEVDTGSATQSGAINEDAPATMGSVIKTGDGTLTLTAVNTYTGSTTVSAGTLTVGSGGSVSGTDITIDSGGAMTVTGAGSELGNGAELVVGNTGQGTLTVSNGGYVSVYDPELANGVGSSGTLTVSGAGSELSARGQFFVGQQGTGVLTISNGAYLDTAVLAVEIGTLGGAVGVTTIDGAGSTWTDAGPVFVGYDGTGTLTVSNGGGVAINQGIGSSQGILTLGQDSGSLGTVTVTGTDSVLTVASRTTVGRAGTGALTISDGGKFIDTSTLSFSIAVGGNDSMLTVDGAGSILTTSGSIVVGNAGSSTGTMTVSNGGSASDVNGVIGYLASSGGVATVTGTGSTWTSSGTLTVGEGGTGALTISNGGSVSSAVSVIGDQAGSVGSVTVTGTGSSWSSGNLAVGNLGSGTMTISNGGRVTSGVGGVGFSPLLYPGSPAGGTGSVTITGANSSWNVSTLNVGTAAYADGSGLGTVLIEDGATLSVSQTSALINGSITVTGVNADGTASSMVLHGYGLAYGGVANNFFGYGNAPASTVNVEDGGQVRTAGAYQNIIGLANANAVTVNITGVNAASGIASTWTDTSPLQIGYMGTGVVNVEDGGQFVTSSVVMSNYNSTIFETLALNGPGKPVLNEKATVNVTGVNADGLRSTWTVNSLIVNDFSPTINHGDFVNILDGGEVSAGTIQLGQSSTAQTFGDVTVSGVDAASGLASTLNVTGTLNSLMGKVLVEDGGSATVGAYAMAGASTLTVEGVNAGGDVSTFAVTGLLAVNTTITGSVSVQDGGLLTSGSAVLGNGATSNAQVIVTGVNADGTHSTWENAGAMTVGVSNSGILTVANGGIVNVTSGTGSITLATNSGSKGTINIGAAVGATPTAPGTIEASSIVGGAGTTLVNFNHTDSDYHFAPSLSGSLSVQQNAGTTILTGASTYTGATAINGGTLSVAGSLGNTAVSVNNGGTLGGSGSIAGNVTMQNGGILAPGGASTLTIGNLVLNSGSQLNFQLNTPNEIGGGNDLVAVTNNLTLAGVLNVTPLTNFGFGTYTLFTYGGTLTDNGLNFGIVPGGYNLSIETGSDVVTLQVGSGAQYWNGTTTSPDNTVHGGDGTWDSVTTNWTDAAGNASSAWANDVAVFSGTAGTVTVSGTQTIAGLHFTTDGYTITGGALDVGTGAQLQIDSGLTATLASTLTGTGSLTKLGAGTIILSGANDYLGGTTINAGTLQISSDANLGDPSDPLTVNNGTLASTTDITTTRVINLGGAPVFDVAEGTTFTADGMVGGASNFDKEGAGAFVFGAAPGYTGGTILNDGTLNTGSHDLTTTFLTGAGGTLSMGAGLLTLDQDTSTTFSGEITGSGGIVKNGAGILVFNGDNFYTGSVTVNGGTLRAGADGALAESGYTVNNGVLDLNNHDTTASALSGAGGAVNLGTATLTVDQDSDTTYAGSINGVYNGISGSNGTVNKIGSGQLQLTGQSNVGGPVIITNGSVDVASGAGVDAELTAVDTGASLSVEGTLTQSNDLEVGVNGSASVTIQNGGVVSDLDGILGQNPHQTAQVTVDGAGSIWTNSGDLLVGSNAFGEVDITNGGFVSAATTELATNFSTRGTFNISSGGVLETGQITKGTHPGAAASITLDGGTLRATQTQNDYLSNFAPGDVTLASGGGTIDTNGNNIGIQTVIGGTGSLTKTSPGILNLSAENTYEGTTIIRGGVLQLGAVDAIARGSAIGLTGGVFDLNGFSPAAFANALTVAGAGSAIDFGFGHIGGDTLQFADSSGVAWTSDVTLLDFTVGADKLNFTNSTGLTSTQLADITLDGYSAIGLNSEGDVEFQTAAVPEPTVTMLLPFALGLMAFAFWRRQRLER